MKLMWLFAPAYEQNLWELVVLEISEHEKFL